MDTICNLVTLGARCAVLRVPVLKIKESSRELNDIHSLTLMVKECNKKIDNAKCVH